MDEEFEQRIREKAFFLWIEEGQPEGRAEHHWGLARELVAIEDGQMATTRLKSQANRSNRSKLWKTLASFRP